MGASTTSSGAIVIALTSKRTWSLPLPVQPWAIASAPRSRAMSTRWRVISGRDRALTSGYLPMYSAFAAIEGATKSSANSVFASTTTASTAPQSSARWRTRSSSLAVPSTPGALWGPTWPMSTAQAIV
jgi:hypothetical protein